MRAATWQVPDGAHGATRPTSAITFVGRLSNYGFPRQGACPTIAIGGDGNAPRRAVPCHRSNSIATRRKLRRIISWCRNNQPPKIGLFYPSSLFSSRRARPPVTSARGPPGFRRQIGSGSPFTACRSVPVFNQHHPLTCFLSSRHVSSILSRQDRPLMAGPLHLTRSRKTLRKRWKSDRQRGLSVNSSARQDTQSAPMTGILWRKAPNSPLALWSKQTRGP